MATATKTEKTAPKMKSAKDYIETVGRRKTAIARVRIAEASKMNVLVNGKTLESYFGTPELRDTVTAPMTREGAVGKFEVTALVRGGGVRAQAEAIRHGIARGLVKDDEETRKELKKAGFLKRDSRKKERKHFGLKKARKASQWSKR